MSKAISLIKNIKSPAETIQFAKDGKYEEAWIIQIDDKCPSLHQIQDYLKKESYEKIAVEFIWNQDDDAKRFVLTVIHSDKTALETSINYIQSCLNIFFAKTSAFQMIDQYDHQIIEKSCLLQKPVQHIRLGVFNHWFSVGPIEIWDQGEEINLSTILDKINNRKNVKSSKLNYQGLAFIYNFDGKEAGPYHVLKTPCCKKTTDSWIVDNQLVRYYVKLLAR